MKEQTEMSNNLRVVSLQAANVLRLSAIEFVWDAAQSVFTVGGRNGAGKSSVLNAVAMALGGGALCPDEPIKRGEAEGFVEVDLGDLKVRREFSREKIYNCVLPEGVLHKHTDECPSVWSETKSRITVRNADGVRLGTPQAVLDKLLGKLTFDPLLFATMGNEGADGRKRQDAILRQLVGLDLSDIDERRKAAAQRRQDLNREVKAAGARLDAMPFYPDAPGEEVSMEAVAAEMRRAGELRELANDAVRAVDKHQADLQASERTLAERKELAAQQRVKIEELQRLLKTNEEAVEKLAAAVETIRGNVVSVVAAANEARAAVPDTTAIQTRLAEVEDTNRKVRANAAHAAEKRRLKELEDKAGFEDGYVQAADKDKADRLAAARFPVEGLGLSDDGVTFNGLPFSQASTAEQIRVSVAIGFALNPGLKLLLVRNGNALDDDSRAVVAAQAAAAGGQILMEYVTKDAGQVSVMIEDGRMA